MNDAATIARGLTSAQKRALLWLPGDGGDSSDDADQWAEHVTGLCHLSHMDLCWAIEDAGWKASPTGLAVRAELERMEAGDA